MSEIYRMALIATTGVVLLLAILTLLGRRISRNRDRAKARFRDSLAELGEAFRETGNASGKPRGLRWVGCDLSGEVEFALERAGGRLVALAEATLSFEAIEGEDMEDVAAVNLPRHATAVFTWDGREWRPTSRTVMNHTPAEALMRFSAEFVEG